MKTFNFTIFFLSLLASGCITTPNNTYECQDEQGKPVEGALMICDYSLPNRASDGINYYYSDQNGVWNANLDGIAFKAMGTPRGVLFVYSEKLHSGARGDGLFKHILEEQNRVYYSIYAIRENHPEGPITVFKDGNQDPYVWMESLNYLHGLLARTDISWGGRGVGKVTEVMRNLYKREVDLFLLRYGDTIVDPNYIKYYNSAFSLTDIKSRKIGDTFKDIILNKILIK